MIAHRLGDTCEQYGRIIRFVDGCLLIYRNNKNSEFVTCAVDIKVTLVTFLFIRGAFVVSYHNLLHCGLSVPALCFAAVRSFHYLSVSLPVD